RTSDQEKKINALIKAEKAIDRANKQKVAVRKLLNAEKEAERKARTRHLIQLGALFEIAKLDQRDPAELLGVLIKTAEIDPNDMKWQIWKDLGQEMLNKRSNENKKSGGVSKSMLTLNEAIIDVKKG
ncbi:conjugal transfer protein TraD, partial [Acinetobacter sp. YH16042]